MNSDRFNELELPKRILRHLPTKRNGLSDMSIALSLETLKDMIRHKSEDEDNLQRRLPYSQSHL